MEITPDHLVLFRWGFVHLNATIVYTWVVMLLLILAAWLATRKIDWDVPSNKWQNALEAILATIRSQIHEISGSREGGDQCVPFVGTLFLFIAVSNVLDAAPGWHAPTGSLSTTAALAICVAVSVPVFGIRKWGLRRYLQHYLHPNVIMAPLHVLSEFSRTIALAVRLFGNIMSGTMVVMLLLIIAPFFVPVVMQLLGILIGLIQAYIFAILAMVYIAAALRSQEEEAPAQSR
jgi:F-type H+-transporting ATPase subunit a